MTTFKTSQKGDATVSYTKAVKITGNFLPLRSWFVAFIFCRSVNQRSHRLVFGHQGVVLPFFLTVPNFLVFPGRKVRFLRQTPRELTRTIQEEICKPEQRAVVSSVIRCKGCVFLRGKERPDSSARDNLEFYSDLLFRRERCIPK